MRWVARDLNGYRGIGSSPTRCPSQRLQAMADLERSGLSSRGLLPKGLDRLLADFSDLAGFMARVAGDELAGKHITAADNQRLEIIGGTLEDFWWRTSDGPRFAMPSTDEMAAVVADIASGRDHTTGNISVLEVGTGYVDQILVLVPDDQGGFAVAEGGVYSYYEFTQPVSDRLTDEAWRSMLTSGEAPSRPAWIVPTMR